MPVYSKPCRGTDFQILCLAMKGGLTDGNFREIARVGVKRVKLDGSDAVPGGNFKPLTYKQFVRCVIGSEEEDTDI